MGCDIHMHVEGKKTINKVEKWVSGDYFSVNPYFEDEGEEKYKIAPIYDNRDYRMFSILAGVRNYTDITPISELRGIPDDCCSEIAASSEYWGSDGHSHSFLTLAELEEYANKQIKTKYSGYVHKSEIEKPLRGECPSSWCQQTNAEGYSYIEREVADNPLDPIIKTLRERARELFWCFTDEQISEFSKKIRIVFWFDN